MIYYLNEEYEGGNLRLHNMQNQIFGESVKEDGAFDIEPKLGTLVIFRR